MTDTITKDSYESENSNTEFVKVKDKNLLLRIFDIFG